MESLPFFLLPNALVKCAVVEPSLAETELSSLPPSFP